jgi:tetratricopeptide (TPR) repeat protein
MVADVPSAHSYSLLSRAYSLFAEKYAVVGSGDEKKEEKPKKRGGLLGKILGGGKDDNDKKDESKTDLSKFVVPQTAVDAAAFAKKAADEAVKLDASSGEAQLALGLALVASDKNGSNKNDALAALGKAAFLEPKNASTHYGMGFGIRNFGEDIKDENARKTELQRAVSELKQATDLRPDYYEAHRELAFCYHLMGDLSAAQREYELANSYRGAASDEDEIAAVNLSLAAIHTEEASKSTDDNQKKEHLAASEGYQSDAKEVQPDLTRALMILSRASLGSKIQDFLPPEMKRVLSLPDDIRSKINVPIRIPGVP